MIHYLLVITVYRLWKYTYCFFPKYIEIALIKTYV